MAIAPIQKVTEDSTDEALWGAFLRGDDICFLWLVERYREQVGSFAWRMVRDIGLAEQIAVESFARLYDLKPKLTGRFRLLLFGQVHALFGLAKQRVAGQSTEATPAFGAGRPGTPEEAAARGEERWRMETSLEQVGEGHRACLLLYYAHKLNVHEIAEVLGLREHEIPGQMAYARRLLRKQLQVEV
jgi:RNA polymerase sigma factor (sigma-70 family)